MYRPTPLAPKTRGPGSGHHRLAARKTIADRSPVWVLMLEFGLVPGEPSRSPHVLFTIGDFVVLSVGGDAGSIDTHAVTEVAQQLLKDEHLGARRRERPVPDRDEPLDPCRLVDRTLQHAAEILGTRSNRIGARSSYAARHRNRLEGNVLRKSLGRLIPLRVEPPCFRQASEIDSYTGQHVVRNRELNDRLIETRAGCGVVIVETEVPGRSELTERGDIGKHEPSLGAVPEVLDANNFDQCVIDESQHPCGVDRFSNRVAPRTRGVLVEAKQPVVGGVRVLDPDHAVDELVGSAEITKLIGRDSLASLSSSIE